MVWWGVVAGIVTGVLVVAAGPLLGPLFTGDRAVRDLLVPVLLVVALGQPVCGIVFVLDGVLIGAGDGRYLAYGGLLTLVAYAPVVLLLHGSLVAVWIAFSAVFMGARLVVLVHRARRDAWLVTGVATP
jgi:Na+-driven multidrug efflux pump